MDNIKDFDRVLLELQKSIQARPDEKYRLLLRVVRETQCPYLRKRVKALYKN